MSSTPALPRLDFLADLVEEQIAKGHLRWLANFSEIHRDHAIGDFRVPIYAVGGLEERGFFLSRIFSFFVTPKYKVHFVLYTAAKVSAESLRKLVRSCKRKFGIDDWILIGVVQKKPMEKAMKNAVSSIDDRRVGIAAYSLASKDEIESNNVLGRSLKKRLKLTEVKFEPIDVPDYFKSIAIVFSLGVLSLVAMLSLSLPAVTPLSLLITFFFSVVLGYPVYKNRYHVVLSLDDHGFRLRRGRTLTEGKWSGFEDAWIHFDSKRESYIRLYSKGKSVDLPVSRVGFSRKEVYNAIKERVRKK